MDNERCLCRIIQHNQQTKKPGLGWKDKLIKVNLFLGFLPEPTFSISWPSTGALGDPQVGFSGWLPFGVWAEGGQHSGYLWILPRGEHGTQQTGGPSFLLNMMDERKDGRRRQNEKKKENDKDAPLPGIWGPGWPGGTYRHTVSLNQALGLHGNVQAPISPKGWNLGCQPFSFIP